jgi:thiosulfate/3-mercaptopyruvate sulfurtransferase
MKNKALRFVIIGLLLILAVVWTLTSASRETAAQTASGDYPNEEILATAKWLKKHQKDVGLLIVDVRTDKYFDGKLISGAMRLPWSTFRYNDKANNLGEKFVGTSRAQEILGNNGIAPNNTVVLYDSVKRDGGATASYFFWVLDVLGHGNKKVLEGGIDAWVAADGKLSSEPLKLDPVLYQAKKEDIASRKLIGGDYVYKRLGDPYYQIIDARSHEEYVGEAGSKDLFGNPLKLGHVPTAININYESAWVDKETKKIKPYPELQQLYKGIDPNKSVIVYCASGRRSSFSYFIMRLMGMSDPITYEHSWLEWGNPDNFYPVETTVRKPAGDFLPEAGKVSATTTKTSRASGKTGQKTPSSTGGKPKGGYVSCGG